MKRLAICLVLVGCAPTYFHSGDPAMNEPERLERETYLCDQEAAEHANNMGLAGNPFAMAEYRDKCMEAKGYEEGGTE